MRVVKKPRLSNKEEVEGNPSLIIKAKVQQSEKVHICASLLLTTTVTKNRHPLYRVSATFVRKSGDFYLG